MRSATQGEKAALVQELRKEGHRLNDLLDAIGLSRSTYYYELGRTDKVKERNAELSSEIVAIFNENRKRYGVRRVHHELLNRGFRVNHKRVQRIMNQLALCGKRPKEKYHSYKGDVGKVADNMINRDFSTEKPLQKWTTDVSQFNLSWGKCYRRSHKRCFLFDYNRIIPFPHAKSQLLLSRAVYLCQFFLSSIENIVCHNLTFILHLLIH